MWSRCTSAISCYLVAPQKGTLVSLCPSYTGGSLAVRVTSSLGKFKMTHALKILSLMLPVAAAFECSSSAFQALLPSTATIISASYIPDNATFQVPADNIAYPTSPTQLRALCAVHINVTSSSTSAYQFGLFLPDDWNERFLAVGNGGFAGGVNWLDMVSGPKG